MTFSRSTKNTDIITWIDVYTKTYDSPVFRFFIKTTIFCCSNKEIIIDFINNKL